MYIVDATTLGISRTSPSINWDQVIENWFGEFPVQSKNQYWKEEGKVFKYQLNLPGNNKDTIKLVVEEDYITLSSVDEKFDTKTIYLPVYCDREKVTASMKDGVLYIEVPKKNDEYVVTIK